MWVTRAMMGIAKRLAHFPAGAPAVMLMHKPLPRFPVGAAAAKERDFMAENRRAASTGTAAGAGPRKGKVVYFCPDVTTQSSCFQPATLHTLCTVPHCTTQLCTPLHRATEEASDVCQAVRNQHRLRQGAFDAKCYPEFNTCVHCCSGSNTQCIVKESTQRSALRVQCVGCCLLLSFIPPCLLTRFRRI
jgi:hypothetical protein